MKDALKPLSPADPNYNGPTGKIFKLEPIWLKKAVTEGPDFENRRIYDGPGVSPMAAPRFVAAENGEQE